MINSCTDCLCMLHVTSMSRACGAFFFQDAMVEVVETKLLDAEWKYFSTIPYSTRTKQFEVPSRHRIADFYQAKQARPACRRQPVRLAHFSQIDSERVVLSSWFPVVWY